VRLVDIPSTSSGQALPARQAAPDGRIDQLVYELCSLTDSEINLVEEATRTP